MPFRIEHGLCRSIASICYSINKCMLDHGLSASQEIWLQVEGDRGVAVNYLV